jgi:hypothetical protein
MALTLSKTGITDGQTIQVGHVTQSIDALTGIVAYDIKISGSLNLTGSVASFNGFTGNLAGTASWASNTVAANTVRLSNIASNFGYNIPYLSGTGSTPTLYYSAIGPKYNPSTSTLTDDYNNLTLVGTASWANNVATASVVENYVPGTANFTTIYPQGTIYTKLDEVYQSGSINFDLFSSSISNLTGNRDLGANFYNNANNYTSKLLKFRIIGKFSNSSGNTFNSYVQLGPDPNQGILPSTEIGPITLQFHENKPFEILYDIIFQNSTIRTCGSIAYCDQTGDLRRLPISNLYTTDPINPAMAGDIQFIVSGSSNTIMTASLAYIEFMN